MQSADAFGDRVGDIVEHCSDTFEDPKPDWKPRKQAYLERLAGADELTLLVSAADKLHNARATLRDVKASNVGGTDVWKRFSASKADSLWYYDELIKAYDRGEPDPRRVGVVRELRETVAALHGS